MHALVPKRSGPANRGKPPGDCRGNATVGRSVDLAVGVLCAYSVFRIPRSGQCKRECGRDRVPEEHNSDVLVPRLKIDGHRSEDPDSQSGQSAPERHGRTPPAGASSRPGTGSALLRCICRVVTTTIVHTPRPTAASQISCSYKRATRLCHTRSDASVTRVTTVKGRHLIK